MPTHANDSKMTEMMESLIGNELEYLQKYIFNFYSQFFPRLIRLSKHLMT